MSSTRERRRTSRRSLRSIFCSHPRAARGAALCSWAQTTFTRAQQTKFCSTTSRTCSGFPSLRSLCCGLRLRTTTGRFLCCISASLQWAPRPPLCRRSTAMRTCTFTRSSRRKGSTQALSP
eukprot:Amastigsp_a680770_21.p3 type:complete len:121 gc:universal Amastigsp_a680770_21:518-880(+)